MLKTKRIKPKQVLQLFVLILLFVGTVCFLTACNRGSQNSDSSNNVNKVKDVPKPALTKETYPKVDGSTATIPLSEAYASSILGLTTQEATSFIHHNTTHNAYVNLVENDTDLILVTEPSDEELAMAAEKKLTLEVVPIVKEAFVFLVNVNNPVTSLTTKQLQQIYEGKITNWKEVGGNDVPIIAYQRNKNSGSQTIMENTVMKGRKMKDAPTDVVEGMEGLIQRIASYDNSNQALGYSVYYYAKTMYNKDTIKFLAVDGVLPDRKTISNGTYPFSSAYYAVLRKSDPQDASSRKLLNWILGKEGQQVSDTAGYIPLVVD